ncbi:MAG: calcium-binding protein, partial [Novosphingobium sp.]|nr:calcium-binding protein [Novosphingobium sp.]
MSIITFNGTSGFSFEWDFTAVGLVTSASSTEIILALDGGGTLTLGGTFPTLDPITSRPTSGTIDTIDIASGGETIAIMTSLSAFDFFTWVDANDGTAFNTALLAGNDTITGTPWNDNLIGLSGNDTVYTGGGQDAVHTGAGDDIIALTGPILSGSNFNGGDDDDTIRASIAAAAAPVQPTDLYSTVGLFSAIVSGVETIEFDSQSGEHLRVGMGVWQIGQITGLTGGDGSDQLLVLVTSQVTTSYVLPTLTLTDWNADDSIMLFGTSPVGTTADFTLDSSAYGGQAILIGGAGNDTLTSGAGNDLVVTGGGLDNVHTGAGDDIIVFDGISFGATFNGGDDEDTLRVTSGSMFAIGGPLGNATLLGSSVVTDIETLELASQAGEQLNVLTNAFQLGGFTTLRGGAGTDFLIVSVPAGGGTVTLPGLNLVDWTDGEDILLLSAVGNLDPSIGYTLGTDDHTGTYYIGGGAGNDTLNGADGIDVLTGNGGNDT